ncbi:MAG: alpha/beta fold hydrolase [Actinomycetales bacterium]|nr:alpha/beta fold hydrolase [Actinomycetales bacterium]
MIENKTTFYSEGAKLQASYYYPDGFQPDEPHPVLIVNSGYQGFRDFYPKMFAELYTRRGYVCFGFDYRGMADSEGAKGKVLLDEQIQDVRNAVTFVRTNEQVDTKRIALLGWGMGAANVVAAAAKGHDVAAVVAMNGFYNGERWLRSVHTYDEWTRIIEEVREDRILRVTAGESRLADTFEHYPLDPASKSVVDQELAHMYGFGHPTRLQFTESIIELDVEGAASRLNIPLFIAHGTDNTLHPFAEAEALFAVASTPKTLYRVAGRHNEWMVGDHPVFIQMCDQIELFLVEAFDASVNASPLQRG